MLEGLPADHASRVPPTRCATRTPAPSNETAAAIIVKVGKACNINPQVLLVLLQKEQGLVTDTWPTSSEYRKATGYGCPDSSNVTCDATYNGFFNQVYKAAWAFQRYTMPPGTGPGTDYYSVYSAYPVGQAYPILYQDPYTDSELRFEERRREEQGDAQPVLLHAVHARTRRPSRPASAPATAAPPTATATSSSTSRSGSVRPTSR